jgi:hypothetical protein
MINRGTLALLALISVPCGWSAKAAPAPTCAQALQSARSLATKITGDAGAYFAHRKNYVDYLFGRLRNLSGADKLAENEKLNADPLRQNMLNNLANFQAALETLRAQNCLPEAALRDIEEPATKWARRTVLGQFPAETETERPSK